MGVVVLVFLALFLYFIPSLVGKSKKHAGAIFALNIFLGWTILGWVGALVWAIADEPELTPAETDEVRAYIKKSEDCDPTVWREVKLRQAVLLVQEGERWFAKTENGVLGYISEKAAAKVSFRSRAIGAPVCRIGERDQNAVAVFINFSPSKAADQDRVSAATGAAHPAT